MTSIHASAPSSPSHRGPPPTLLDQFASFPRATLVAAWRAALRFADSDNLTYASSISFFALLSLFPFFMLAFSVLGMLTADEASRLSVFDFVLRYFPRQFDFVTTQVDAFREQRVSLGLAGSLLMMWSSLGVFGAITTAVNYAWRVERTPSFVKHKLVAFLMLMAAGTLMALALVLLSARSVVGASWFAGVADNVPALLWLQGLAVWWASTALFILVTGLIYYFVPNTNKVRFRDVWPGAIVAGLLWRGALTGFSWYVGDLSRFSVHGTIAGVVVFLMWVYVSSVVLLYGVELTVAYAHIRRTSRLVVAEDG